MSETCPTIKVKSDALPDGFVLINESDFDPQRHERFEPAPDAPDAAPDAPARRGRSPKTD